ncbi:MAG: hypothetical protein AAF499_07845 [Pseudomonadota bacterium]
MKHLLLLVLLLFGSAANAAELFGVPLASADKGNLGFAVQRAGATLMQTERNQVYEVFDSRKVLDASFKLYLGFDVQNGKFGFAEYHLYRLAHGAMLKRLTDKYGDPAVDGGEFLTDQRYRWQVNGIDISLQKTHGCMCSRLVYSEPETHKIVKQQHAQVQQQRADEVVQEFIRAY